MRAVSRLVVILLVLGSVTLISAARARAECPRTFRLVTPADWRCTEEENPQCTICRNRALHPTEIVVHCVDDGSDEPRSIPPGGTLAICGGQAS